MHEESRTVTVTVAGSGSVIVWYCGCWAGWFERLVLHFWLERASKGDGVRRGWEGVYYSRVIDVLLECLFMV